MASLHDLIYSQTSAASDPPDLHQPSQEEATEIDQLDAFYHPEETVTFASPEAEQEKDKKKKRKPRIELPWDDKEETASQVERRKRKRQEQREWQEIRHRWKRKKYDLRSEIDHGGAIQHVARLVYNKKNQHEKQASVKETEEEEQVVYVDSSDEERNQRLGSLLTPRPESETKSDSLPSRKEFDYWTQGYVAPKRPEFTYGSKLEKAPLVLKKKHTLQDSDDEQVTIPNMSSVTTRKHEPFRYFPLPHATSCPTTGTFFHQRNLFRMAARCIVGHCNSTTENRLLRALHYKIHRDAHHLPLLMGQARERAVDLQVYYQHEWKNPSVVMQELGLGSEHEHTGPKRLLGFSLKTNALYDDCRNARKRLITKLSNSKVEDAKGQESFGEPNFIENEKDLSVAVTNQADENDVVVKTEKDNDNVTGSNGAAEVLTEEDCKPKAVKNQPSNEIERDPKTVENQSSEVMEQDPKTVENHLCEKMEQGSKTLEKQLSKETEEGPVISITTEGNNEDLPENAANDVIMEDDGGVTGFEDDFGTISWEEDWRYDTVPGALLQPTSNYVHEQGTIPPVPPFPLDQNSLVFGPTDKYASMMHSSDVDATIYALTMSALLSRLGMARQNNSTEAATQVHQQILSYLEQTVKQHPDRTKFVFLHHHDLPIAPLYRAIMGYCSYLANGGAFFKSESNDSLSERITKKERSWSWSDSDSQSDSEHRQQACGPTHATADAVARIIHDHCERFIGDTRLAPFPRVHLTIGIVRIIARLPPAAAAMLSRPCDTMNYRTPCELMRSTLEFLEKEELLVESNVAFSEDETINAGELEHTLHLAVDVFQQCLEVDKTEVIYHEWYIAALAGSLLLCSGNAIGGGARSRPSSKKSESGFDVLLSQDSGRSSHEVRKKLDKFDEARQLLADAVLALNDLAGKQHGPRPHLALSSLLEWKEVVALVIGPSSRKRKGKETNSFEDARRLHAYHTVQWAAKENSASCFRRLEDLLRRNEVTVDTAVVVAAGMLENDPCSIENWRRLAKVLGPIGCKVSKKNRDACKESKCTACKRLRRDFNVDHSGLKERKEKLGWWGEGQEWWNEHVLTFPRWLKSKKPAGSDTVFRVSAFIEKRVLDCAKVRSSYNFDEAAACHSERLPGVGLSSLQNTDLSWLHISFPESDSESDHSDEDDTKPSTLEITDDKNATCDEGLPRSYADVIADTAFCVDRQNDLSSLSKTRSGCVLETLCYKVLVTCHLNGVTQPIVMDCIWFLAQESSEQLSQNKQDCDAWHCLSWLSAMGLSVPQVLHDLYTKMIVKKKRPARERNELFDPRQKQAIRDGVKRFGNDWVKIRTQSDILKEHTNVQIKDCYRWMVKKGEVESQKSSTNELV